MIYLVNFSITLNSLLSLGSLEHIIKILAEFGLRYIEIPGDPANSSSKTNLEIFNTYNLSVLGVSGLQKINKFFHIQKIILKNVLKCAIILEDLFLMFVCYRIMI